VLDVGQGVARVVDADAALSFSCRVQKRTLDVNVGLVRDQAVELRLLPVLASPLQLVDEHAVFVNGGTNHQVRGFVLNKEIA